MRRGHIAHVIVSFVALSLTASLAHALPMEIHQYDMEPTSGFVTQPGWTHVDPSTNYVGTTSAGWDPVRTTHYVPIDEPTQTATPFTDMQRDWTYSLGGMGVVWREIVPAGHGQMKFSIWRNSVDGYNPNYTTTLQLSDDSLTNFTTVFFYDGTLDTFANAPTPITGTLWFAPSASVRYMDFIFSEAGTKRIDGIQTVFPEPASLALLALAAPLLVRRHRA